MDRFLVHLRGRTPTTFAAVALLAGLSACTTMPGDDARAAGESYKAAIASPVRTDQDRRIDEAIVLAEFRQAGFVLDATSDFLRNPADSREQSSGDGRIPTDKFALRFVKP